MAVILIDLDKYVPGHVIADFKSGHDATQYSVAQNIDLPHPEDDSFATIEITGEAPGARSVVRVYGKVVDRAAVAAILDDE